LQRKAKGKCLEAASRTQPSCSRENRSEHFASGVEQPWKRGKAAAAAEEIWQRVRRREANGVPLTTDREPSTSALSFPLLATVFHGLAHGHSAPLEKPPARPTRRAGERLHIWLKICHSQPNRHAAQLHPQVSAPLTTPFAARCICNLLQTHLAFFSSFFPSICYFVYILQNISRGHFVVISAACRRLHVCWCVLACVVAEWVLSYKHAASHFCCCFS